MSWPFVATYQECNSLAHTVVSDFRRNVAPPLGFCLLVVTLAFLPLEAQPTAGRLPSTGLMSTFSNRGYSRHLLDGISPPDAEAFSSFHAILRTILPLIPRQ